jgi:hypothetical protein
MFGQMVLIAAITAFSLGVLRALLVGFGFWPAGTTNDADGLEVHTPSTAPADDKVLATAYGSLKFTTAVHEPPGPGDRCLIDRFAPDRSAQLSVRRDRGHLAGWRSSRLVGPTTVS